MARENQGLQIALIVFVMLAVVLGATTYWTYRLYDEQAGKTKSAMEDAMKNRAQAGKNAKEAEELKRMIDVPKSDSIETITGTFKEDMKKFGGAYREDTRFYRKLLGKMSNTINEKNAELANWKAKVPQLEAKFKKRAEAQELQVKQFKESASKAGKDLASERSKFKSERDRIAQEEASLQSNLQRTRKNAAESLVRTENKVTERDRKIRSLRKYNEDLTAKVERYRGGTMGEANGEVRWVNQRNGTVWINLGRADALSRQVTFSVYPADNTDISKSKGGIEVTQVLGDHLAEARILDDDVSNPILPGDKIFTPLWSPGERRHFALAGLIDIDDDGRSDLEAVMNLIKLNGGVVDCYIADSGRNKNSMRGSIDVNTNCLILGAAPDEKGNPAQRDAFTRILRDADQARIQKVQLGDFLQRVGWKNISPVVRYGRGANPNDFRAQPPEGTVRKSSDDAKGGFKERQPPSTPAPSRGRYHRF